MGASSLSLLPPNQQCRAVAVNKAGHVAIGTNEGELSIRTLQVFNSIYLGLEHLNLGAKNFKIMDWSH